MKKVLFVSLILTSLQIIIAKENADLSKINLVEAVNKISLLKNVALTSKAENLELINKELDNLFKSLEKPNILRQKMHYLKKIYNISKIDIPQAISDVNSLKVNGTIEEHAKKLILDFYNFLQEKLKEKYVYSQNEALKQIRSIYGDNFAKTDLLVSGISKDVNKKIFEIFEKLRLSVALSNNKELQDALERVALLYLETFLVINESVANPKIEQYEKKINEKLSRFKKEYDFVSKFKISSEQEKNAIEILKELLKTYSLIIDKFKSDLKKIERLDIKDVVEKISSINNIALTSRAEGLESINNELNKLSLDLPKNLRIFDRKLAMLNRIYKIANFDIPKAITDLNLFKTKNKIEDHAKKLLIDLYYLIQKKCNKILEEYTYSPKEALNQIENVYKIVYKNSNFNESISIAKLEIFNDLNKKLEILISFADNQYLLERFYAINNLFLWINNEINGLVLFEKGAYYNQMIKLYGEEAPVKLQIKYPQDFKRGLEQQMVILKKTEQNLERFKTETDVAKNAVIIMKALLKIYETVVQKTKTSFIPTEQELKQEISLILQLAFSNYQNLTETGVENKYIERLDRASKKLKLYVDYNGSAKLISIFPEFMRLLDEIIKKINEIKNKYGGLNPENIYLSEELWKQLPASYSEIYEKLNSAENIIKKVITIPLTDARESQNLMLYTIKKYREGFEIFVKSLNKKLNVSLKK